MHEADITSKYLKLDRVLDGNVDSLTVAEVGMVQPREGQ